MHDIIITKKAVITIFSIWGLLDTRNILVRVRVILVVVLT